MELRIDLKYICTFMYLFCVALALMPVCIIVLASVV